MAETKHALEILAYLGMEADSVEDRRHLDELLKTTETSVDDKFVSEEVEEEVVDA